MTTAKISIFIISLITLIASITIFHLTKPNTNQTLNPPSHQTNYIVRFTQYKPSNTHKQYLLQNTNKSSSSSWKWVHRNNPASGYPTDFGLVAVDDVAVGYVIGEFERLEMVKDVTVDSSIRLRDLLNDGNRIGAFSDGKKRRPGKLFTSMSFGEGEDGNLTVDWRRELLSHKSQVTSLFGADSLWSKGYTGAKVKMAIFNTGIRSDHPHFRHIKNALIGPMKILQMIILDMVRLLLE